MNFKLLLILLLIISLNLFSDWEYITSGTDITYVNTLEKLGDYFIAGTNSRGLYYSTNNGLNWNYSISNMGSVMSVIKKDSILFAGFYGLNKGVYFSADSGKTWFQTSLNNQNIVFLTNIDDIIYAGASSPSLGIYYSSNNGISWIQNSLNNQSVYSILNYNNILFAGTIINGIYKSTNNGSNWNQTSLNNRSVLSFAFMGTKLFAGTVDYGIFISNDSGNNWIQSSLNNYQTNTILINGEYIFAGTSVYGVHVSQDSGNSWIPRNEGLFLGLIVRDLHISENYIYTASNNGIYRRTLSELTSVKNHNLPVNNSLFPNYPNPFNPVTNIKFRISVSGYVILKIYDINGKLVEVLVNEKLKTGFYNYSWNAFSYSSGVYFYRIETEGFTDTKKMILVK